MRLVSPHRLSEASIVGGTEAWGLASTLYASSGMRCVLRADILRNRQEPFKPEQISLTELRQVS